MDPQEVCVLWDHHISVAEAALEARLVGGRSRLPGATLLWVWKQGTHGQRVCHGGGGGISSPLRHLDRPPCQVG